MADPPAAQPPTTEERLTMAYAARMAEIGELRAERDALARDLEQETLATASQHKVTEMFRRELEEARATIRAEHALKAAVAGNPCSCVYCHPEET